jgi:hypothetical protein
MSGGLQIGREFRAWRKRRARWRKPNGGRSLEAITRTGLVFIHVPKAGGKTVIRNLYGLEMHGYFGHGSAAFYQSLLGPRGFARLRSFAVVRDPVSRARSAFQFGREGGFGMALGRRFQERVADMDWEAFLLSGLMREAATLYPIFQPQVSFLRGLDGEIACDVLLRTERLSADLELLTEGRIRAATVEVMNRGRDAARVQAAPVSEEERQLVEEVYAEDFELLTGRLVPFVDGTRADGEPSATPRTAGAEG